MDPIWLLTGDFFAPGWKALEKDAKGEEVDVVIFDRDAWALVRAAEPPEYEGFVPSEPKDGLYVAQDGCVEYIVARQLARYPVNVVEALGDDAMKLLAEVRDVDTVLQRLGRAF